MAETNFGALDSAGASQNIDIFKPAGGSFRQAVVLSDPTTSASIVAVQATDPASNVEGLVVRDVNTSAIVSRLGALTTGVAISGTSSTLAVALDPGHTLGFIQGINQSVAVYFDRGNPAVTANAGTGSFTVQFDPGHELGSVKGINSTVAVYFDQSNPSVKANAGTGSFNVQFDPGHTLGQLMPNQSVNVAQFGGANALTPNSGIPVVNIGSTMSIFTASGSASGVSVSGNTIISPSANYSFKVFAFSVQTTGVVSLATKFTNGAGTSPTEFFRPLVSAAASASAPVGANLAVTPPGYLFATGTSTTLALVLDSASLVHYSVSYIKESA